MQIEGAEVQFYSFLTLASDGDECPTSRAGRSTSGKEPRYPLNRMPGGPHGWSGRVEEEGNLLTLPGLEHPSHSPVTKLTAIQAHLYMFEFHTFRVH
jgi:hypothetical protein